MRIHIVMKNGSLPAKVVQRLTEKLRLSLGTFANHIAHAKLVLNSKPDDGGSGRWALVRVDFYSGGRLLLETRGMTSGEAAARALGRIRNAVEREMIRRWEWVDLHLPEAQRTRPLATV